MTPHTNSAFKALQPETSSINFRKEQFEKATRDLINAVSYANENEMSMLVDRAISNGANINYYNSYQTQLMVIAVRNKQAHALPILMARGLHTPYAPENNVDLLMETAAQGYVEIIEPLITVAGMDVFCADSNQKTALHHAAIGGSEEIVNILLDHGAQPNVYTSRMDDAELRSLFGENHNLTGVNVTPLMIASAVGNHKIVALLLESGGNPKQGECLPLVLACINGNAPTIKLLLARETQEKFSNEHEYDFLSIALQNGGSLECLKLLAVHHCFDEDDGTVNSPLCLAIKTKQASSVALLLASGAPIEKFNAEENTLWDEAFINEKKPWELLDLLVTTDPMCNITSPDYSKENFLITFYENCQNPIPLAALGFYPSVVESSRDALQQLHANKSSLSKMEKQLLAAFILSTNLKKLSDESVLVTESSDFIEPDNQWLKMTHAKKIEQNTQLLEETTKFTNEKFNQLKHSLSLKFFIECNNLCPIKHSLKNFILNKLIVDVGIPFHISESIARIWSQAAQWCIDWHVSPHSTTDANRFLTHLTKNLFLKQFSIHDLNTKSLHNHCLMLIGDELGMTTCPLDTFCTNPVAWLRKFENRSNLRAVDVNELANSLQIELGLHISTCQSISTAWSTTINLARKSPQWKNSTELDRLLATVLASYMEHSISDEFGQRIVPEHNRNQLFQWIESVKNQTAQIDSNVSGRKRPPSGDPEGTPNAKEARV
jgi:ankyrin repeat protein